MSTERSEQPEQPLWKDPTVLLIVGFLIVAAPFTFLDNPAIPLLVLCVALGVVLVLADALRSSKRVDLSKTPRTRRTVNWFASAFDGFGGEDDDKRSR